MKSVYKCHRCKEVIENKHIMVPIDIPYKNLFFHPECYEEIKSDMENYLKADVNKIVYEYPSESVKIRKN